MAVSAKPGDFLSCRIEYFRSLNMAAFLYARRLREVPARGVPGREVGKFGQICYAACGRGVHLREICPESHTGAPAIERAAAIDSRIPRGLSAAAGGSPGARAGFHVANKALDLKIKPQVLPGMFWNPCKIDITVQGISPAGSTAIGTLRGV
jgi:hypothetical protein